MQQAASSPDPKANNTPRAQWAKRKCYFALRWSLTFRSKLFVFSYLYFVGIGVCRGQARDGLSKFLIKTRSGFLELTAKVVNKFQISIFRGSFFIHNRLRLQGVPVTEKHGLV